VAALFFWVEFQDGVDLQRQSAWQAHCPSATPSQLKRLDKAAADQVRLVRS
jgi:hypothetical protein